MKPLEIKRFIISDIPNIKNTIKEIEKRLEKNYISKDYIDYCDSLEYKINLYSVLLQQNLIIEIHFHVSSFFRNKTKDVCLRRRIIAPVQIAPEFITYFNNYYMLQENNIWHDKHNVDIIHKIKIDEYVGLVYIDSGERAYLE